MGDGTAGWTLSDAAAWLDPPISAEVLALLVRAAQQSSGACSPIGTRRPPRGSAGGRPAPVYEIRALMELHGAFLPWLTGLRSMWIPEPGPAVECGSERVRRARGPP